MMDGTPSLDEVFGGGLSDVLTFELIPERSSEADSGQFEISSKAPGLGQGKCSRKKKKQDGMVIADKWVRSR